MATYTKIPATATEPDKLEVTTTQASTVDEHTRAWLEQQRDACQAEADAYLAKKADYVALLAECTTLGI